MTDDDVNRETVSVRGLLKELRDGQREMNRKQQEMNVHLAVLNGTVAKLKERSTSHSDKLGDLSSVQSVHSTRLAVVEQVTALRDEHQAQGIRNSASDAWAAQQTAHDVRGETIGWIGQLKQAALQAVFLVVILAVLAALIVMAFR